MVSESKGVRQVTLGGLMLSLRDFNLTPFRKEYTNFVNEYEANTRQVDEKFLKLYGMTYFDLVKNLKISEDTVRRITDKEPITEEERNCTIEFVRFALSVECKEIGEYQNIKENLPSYRS